MLQLWAVNRNNELDVPLPSWQATFAGPPITPASSEQSFDAKFAEEMYLAATDFQRWE